MSECFDVNATNNLINDLNKEIINYEKKINNLKKEIIKLSEIKKKNCVHNKVIDRSICSERTIYYCDKCLLYL